MPRDKGTAKERYTRWFPRVGEAVITTPFADADFGILTRMELIKESDEDGSFTTASGRRFAKFDRNWISDDPTAQIAGDRVLLMLKVTPENKKLFEESRYDAEKRYYIQSIDWETLVSQLTDKETHLLWTTMRQIHNLRNAVAGDHDFPRLAVLPNDRIPMAVPRTAPILSIPVQWFYFLVEDLPALVPEDSAHIVRTDCGQFLAVSAVDPESDDPVTRTVLLKERVIHGWIAAGILSEGVDNPERERDRRFTPLLQL